MKVQIKKLCNEAVIPQYAHLTDAGMDLTAISKTYDSIGNVVYGFGLAIEIPEGYVGYIFPRSSNCKHSLTLTNSVGVIDSGYRGEIKAVFSHNVFCLQHKSLWQRFRSLFTGMNTRDNYRIRALKPNDYEVGDRVAQLIIMPYPKIEFEEVDTLSPSDRGQGGYGSTGK